ncbi:MAG: hypothetical protein K0R54_544 [Clostridiaceae bacterium]|jgi:hypothetical protein|nr:hypothetical protein [Clostridiaceae bacterium]
MNREIKVMETCVSEKYGSDYVYIDLDDYSDTKTIKCTVLNYGDKLKPVFYGYNGNPYFKYDTFMKYAKKDHYARIYVEVEYEPKELDLPVEIFNTVTGIDNYVVDLETLHKIIEVRSVAYRKKKMKLKEFVWKNLLSFDEFGQVLVISGQEFIGQKILSEKDFKDSIPLFIHTETVEIYIYKRYVNRYTCHYERIPYADEICPECGEKWTLETLNDFILVNQDNFKKNSYHKECLKKHNSREQLKEFTDILFMVYSLKNITFTEIPNEYCPCDHCSPWFIVSTPDGDIKIGWRKRVINIKWLENYKKFSDTFEYEDVTKRFSEERYIHAWSTERAIEYIKRAKMSIIIENKVGESNEFEVASNLG